MRKPPYLPVGKYTEQNRYALQLYKDACAILEMPFSVRKEAIQGSDNPDKLTAEVIRVFNLRQQKTR